MLQVKNGRGYSTLSQTLLFPTLLKIVLESLPIANRVEAIQVNVLLDKSLMDWVLMSKELIETVIPLIPVEHRPKILERIIDPEKKSLVGQLLAHPILSFKDPAPVDGVLELSHLHHLCIHYQTYLLKELDKVSNGSFDLRPRIANVTYSALLRKFMITEELLSIITDEGNPKEKLNAFKVTLKNYENELSTHRDGPIGRFIANLWGVLAALPRLMLYSNASSSIRHPAFWRSTGEQLCHEISRLSPNI